VVANDIAVHINASCEENKLYKNNFIENLSGLVVDAKGYPNYWADEGMGNYWSGYPGYDLDGDGIGDEPYRLQSVFEYLESGFPEVRLYLFSPAAQILEAAERVFPILHPSEKKDPLPLMKPVEIEGIPWELLQNKPQEASVAFLILFGIFTLTPIILISWNQK
jgi:nitrous oxidase accessory protein